MDGLRNPRFTRYILILCYRTWLPTDRDELVIWLWTLGASRRLLIKLAAITDGQKFDFGVFTETNKKIYIHTAIFACTHINLRLFLCFFCSFFFLIFFLTEEPCNKCSTQESKTSCDVMSPHLFCFVLFFFYQLHWEKPKKIIMWCFVLCYFLKFIFSSTALGEA